ncbi:hypothetical protein C8Q74DRAFT_1243611 [Fomes fomentarius]|nr:hypothetical protein C8Q74DRAFT_1243611 [Fomes fomentarius]
MPHIRRARPLDRILLAHSYPSMLYLSTRPRHGMYTSRLPIDICEHVIDAACFGDPDWGGLDVDCYGTWYQTALVCYDWFPRSQLNLFRDINICSVSRLDLLLRTFSDAPQLADLVSGVHISPPKGEYIPYPRLLHPRLLRNCIRLHLGEVPWKAFPSRYADRSLCPFRDLGITHFEIELEQGCCASVLRFLYTLPLLQELTLTVWSETVHIPTKVLAILHDRPCPFANLKTLCLGGLAPGITFPPLLFPDSITSLKMCVYGVSISGTTRRLLQSLRQLQHLEVVCAMPNDPLWCLKGSQWEAYRTQCHTFFLNSLRSHLNSVLSHLKAAALTQFAILFIPIGIGNKRGHTYGFSRDGFLEDVVGSRELTETLRPLSILRHLHIILAENDLFRYHEKWWRAEIAAHLQGHLRNVAVDVTLVDHTADWDLLWCTGAELWKATLED